jgi:hypothetical protein
MLSTSYNCEAFTWDILHIDVQEHIFQKQKMVSIFKKCVKLKGLDYPKIGH